VVLVSAREIPIQDLAEFCDSLGHQLMKEHEKRFGERTKAVKEAANGFSSAATRFSLGVKNAWGTLDKTASEYGMRLAHIIQETSQGLSQKQVASSFDDSEKFHEESVEALNKIIITIRRYLPKLQRALKAELAALNSSLARLENSIKALGKALDDSPGLRLRSLQRDVQLLIQRQEELTRLRTEESKAKEILDEAATRERELLSKKEELTSLAEFLELKRYEDSLNLKEEEMRQLLQPLAKPLLKLERAVAVKQGPSVDERTLRNLIDSPEEAVVTGRIFDITELLASIEGMLSRGELEIEERKRRKAEVTIRSIKEGAIDRLREEYQALQVNLTETQRQLRAKGLLERKDKLDKQLTEERFQKEARLAQQKELQRRIDELGGTILKEKTSLETQTSKLTHKTMTIQAG
jgi:DNA repair exonuclease SbcCD ATPase subunit